VGVLTSRGMRGAEFFGGYDIKCAMAVRHHRFWGLMYKTTKKYHKREYYHEQKSIQKTNVKNEKLQKLFVSICSNRFSAKIEGVI